MTAGEMQLFAVCPPGLTIQSGWSFYIVPDGSGPAYGICGTKSVSCVPGTGSCAVETANKKNRAIKMALCVPGNGIE